MNWPHPPVAAGEPPAAVMIELAPVPVAPEAPQQEVAVGPEMVMSETSNPSENQEKPVERAERKPDPEPQPDKPVTEPVEKEITAEAETPKLEEIPTAEAVLPAPAEKPPEPEKAAEEKPEPPKPKEEQESKPQDAAKKLAPATTAPKPVLLPRAKTNAAPSAGVSSSTSMATWRGMLMAHLNRLKRYPAGGGRGTSSVVFTIDRSGRVLSTRLIGSSGSAVLDGEAVSLARRASPVPAPPANIAGRGNVTLTVPIRFSR
jgi:protein TonB